MPTTRLMTADDPLMLPDDGLAHELVRGVLISMPLPGTEHGATQVNVLLPLGMFVAERNLGRVFGETGFRLAHDPDTVRAPDVAFVAAARLPSQLPAGYLPFGPDLAIEVKSPWEPWPEMEAKLAEYFAAGTRLAWVLDPERRVARVYAPDRPPRELGPDDALDGEDVVPGFALPLRRVFR